MEVILLKNIDKVGSKSEIVTVKDGYGRNYLIPQKLAIIANATNRGKLDELVAKQNAEEEKEIALFKEYLTKIEANVLNIGVKAGTSGKIFGSVTTVQLQQALKEQLSIDIDRKLINIAEEVKEVGEYEADINLHASVTGKVKFNVVAE